MSKPDPFYFDVKTDTFAKNPKYRHACEGRHPEPFEITGFPLQFIPHLMRGGNDDKGAFLSIYETIKTVKLKFVSHGIVI